MSKAATKRKTKSRPAPKHKAAPRASMKKPTAHKVFRGEDLYGAVPGMDRWAIPELERMRDEW